MKSYSPFGKLIIMLIFCNFLLTAPAFVIAQNPIGDLTASTFLGGSKSELFVLSTDQAGFMLHPNGDLYICGPTKSIDFPTTSGVYQREFKGGDTDSFIARMSADLSTLLACTFIGGSSEDVITDIRINENGDVVVCGYTTSFDFPVTANAYDTTFNDGAFGQGDAFISVIDENLVNLLSSTYLGGSSSERFHHMRMDIDTGGNVIIAGGTMSSDFPVTAGALFEGPINQNDLFISKLTGDLSQLSASSYFGANGWDQVLDLLTDTAGQIYICGGTEGYNFPVTPSAFDQQFNGDMDAYLSILGNNLDTIIASTFLGGTESENIVSMDFDGSGNVIVAGRTASIDFPVTMNAFDTSFNLGYDCFVGIFEPRLGNMLHCTFLGGDDWDEAYDVLYDSSINSIFLTGLAGNGKYPVLNNAWDPSFNGETDCFITRMNADLSEIEASTFLGANMNEFGLELELSNDDQLLICGNVSSELFPVTSGAYDTSINGVYDIFISKFVKDLSGPPVGTEEIYLNKFEAKAAPNPFNDRLRISFNHPGKMENSRIQIRLYNSLGNMIYEKERESINMNSNEIIVQAGKLPAGIYLCRIDILKDNVVLHQQTLKIVKK